MQRKIPLVSVVMPSYNSAKYIEAAINSILNQTFSEFEFIIVNDCSEDDSLQIISKYAKKDRRIKVLNNKKRLNIAASLNHGINYAKAKIIARMDADDISHPNRLELQYKLIQSNKKISVVGANIIIMDSDARDTAIRNYPVTSEDLKGCLFRYSPFAHPAVMFKKNVFLRIGGYNPMYSPTEDLDLWFRMGINHEFSSIPKPLLHYRIYEKSSSNQNLKNLEKLVFRIRWKAMVKYGYKPKTYDLVYNLLQFVTLWFTPTKWRVIIYNSLRNSNLI